MTFKIGILGGGGISETHAQAATEIPGVEVAAVHGGNPERCQALARRFGGAAYPDLEGFLRHPGLDAVLIGSPSGLHAEQAIAAARQGLHVLVEKPLDISVERVDAVIEACERAGVRLGVFFQGRAAPDLRWLRRLVASGGIGRVFLAAAQVKWYRPPEYYAASRWRGTWALDGGGALMNQGIHTVDLLLWLLGEVTRVSARTRTALHHIETEDTVVATLEFTGGAVATLEATTAAFPGFPRRLEVTGTAGTVTVEHDAVRSVQTLATPSEPPPGGGRDDNQNSSSAAVKDVRGHRAVIENFVAAVRSGADLLCDGRQGRRSVAVVEAIYRSAASGSEVTVQAG
jgi:UDP-N-acetyl-2-amino-2-deoxyglucuronate dehydrogenase